MDTELFAAIGYGFTALGLILIVMDYFMSRLADRANPPNSPLRKEEWMITFETDEERRRYRIRKKHFQSIMRHRMQKGGLFLLALGFTGLIVLLIAHKNSLS